VETFDCDHNYSATAGYDSVRVAIYVTHDSNTFFWEGGQKWGCGLSNQLFICRRTSAGVLKPGQRC
jgi:hypothetical protein